MRKIILCVLFFISHFVDAQLPLIPNYQRSTGWLINYTETKPGGFLSERNASMYPSEPRAKMLIGGYRIDTESANSASYQLEVTNDINLLTTFFHNDPEELEMKAYRIDGVPYLHNKGFNSLSVGPDAGTKNTGTENVFGGYQSGFSNLGGGFNTFIGAHAGRSNTVGSGNTFVGQSAGISNMTGTENTYIGQGAGRFNVSSSKNTYIGHFASGTSGLFNASAIGAHAVVTADNSMVLGRDVNVGINVSAPLFKLHVEGTIFASNGALLINTQLNKLSSAYTGSFGGAKSFNFNPGETPGVILESGEGDESSGFYAGSDYAVIWSPGNKERLLKVLDEDGMIERWYLDGNGKAYTTLNNSNMQNATSLKNALERITALNGISYEVKPNPQARTKTTQSQKNIETTVPTTGFMPRELEAILPEAVATDELGNKFANYDAIIPFLVEAIKSQQMQIDSLKSLSRNRQNSTAVLLNSGAVLYQNTPNPFQENTSITFYLPEPVQRASVYVYNMQGILLREYKVANRGHASIEITGGELMPGMYLYSLIADGKEIDTKRMILSQ
jgi:hypothetical protein